MIGINFKNMITLMDKSGIDKRYEKEKECYYGRI